MKDFELIDDKQITVGDTTALADLKQFVATRNEMMDFVKSQLKEGRDYGKQFRGDTKKNILKPGCEKITGWLNLMVKPFPDTASWEMIGKTEGTIFFTTYLISRQNLATLHELIKDLGTENEEMAYRELAVAIGKGAASTTEGKIKDANTCVKKAKIRSYKDAVLSLGLSEEFTQDAEDYRDNGNVATKKEARPQNTTPKATPHEGEGWDVHNKWHAEGVSEGQRLAARIVARLLKDNAAAYDADYTHGVTMEMGTVPALKRIHDIQNELIEKAEAAAAAGIIDKATIPTF